MLKPKENYMSILKGLRILDQNLKKDTKDSGRKYCIDELDNHNIIAHDLNNIAEATEKAAMQHTLLFYSYLKSALLDWGGINKWVLQGNDKFDFLILDDLMWEQKWPEKSGEREREFLKSLMKVKALAEEISDRKWNFHRLLRPSGDKTFYKYVLGVIKEDDQISYELIPIEATKSKEPNNKKRICDFTHLLIDWKIDDKDEQSGLNLVRDLKTYIAKNSEKISTIPELLILTRNPDPVTIQSALESGASGYIVKDNIASLPYVVGRAGKPLTVAEKKEIDEFTSDNFPSLRNFPAFVPKALYFDVWKKNSEFERKNNGHNENSFDDPVIVGEHKKWLKKIPKADLHVHFGTAIPLDICYELAIISVYRWLNQYEYKAGSEGYKGSDKDKKRQITDAKNLIEKILKAAVECDKAKDAEGFRVCYMESFKKITNIYEVVTVNNTIKRLHRIFDKLSEELIACLVVVGLGYLRKNGYTEDSIKDRIGELGKISNILNILNQKNALNPLLKFYLQDTTKIIEDAVKIYDSKQINISLYYNFSIKLESFDPLSSLLSIPDELQSQALGLPKYLGAGDLVGASLLQFTETLLLASYRIPIWAAEQNIWHQELRAGANGFLKSLKNPTIATKVMMLGLYAGIKTVVEAHDKPVTTSVLITAKRHKDKEDIKEAVQLAAEFVTRNEKGVEDTNSQEFIPKVLGMDLAGAERGNLPDDLVESFKESFKRCLMMTVHAGEDESVESVWQAVYSLHASRVGHGLRLDDHSDLKRLFKDRQLCVELCPKSNQFTNGYAFKDHEKPEELCYVLKDYMDYGIPLTINTDNPAISHRAHGHKMDYPLSEEYLALPSLICTSPGNCKKSNSGCKRDKSFFINCLLILKLIYNGFKYSFLSPKEKARLIEYADREVFNALAEEFLDVYISAER